MIVDLLIVDQKLVKYENVIFQMAYENFNVVYTVNVADSLKNRRHRTWMPSQCR